MVEVKIAKFKSKRNKLSGYTVAIVLRMKGKKMLSYQGRYKNRKDAEKKRKDLIKLLSNTKKNSGKGGG